MYLVLQLKDQVIDSMPISPAQFNNGSTIKYLSQLLIARNQSLLNSAAEKPLIYIEKRFTPLSTFPFERFYMFGSN